ncbi:hypothetical protein Tco_0867138 [Tanacetum coccineum]
MMTLLSEHLLTFNKLKDAKSLFETIEARFGGNEATKKTQKILLKQMYETFNASSSESLDSIFNRLQKIVSQLTILGEIITPEDLNLKFLRSLLTEWGHSSTNDVNNANVHVSTGSTPLSTASTNNSTSCLSDATIYAYLATQPNGSQVVHEDLEKIHEDDLDEIDLKWQLALLKKGGIARECRNPRSQENRNRSLDSSRRTVNVEEFSSKAMLAIDGTGFDWSYMTDEEASTNFRLMAFSDSEITVLKRDASFNELDINGLKKQVERLKKEKEDNQFKIDNFEIASKSLDQLIGNQISDNNKKGLGYNVVPLLVLIYQTQDLRNLNSLNLKDTVLRYKDETVVLESLNVQKPKQADQPWKVSQNPRNYSTSWNTPMPKKLGVGFQFTPKACFVCGSFNHLIKDCDFHDKRMVQKPVLNNVKKGTGQREVRPVWTNAMRVNHQKFSNSRRNFAPTAVLTKSGLVPFSTARQSFSRTTTSVSAARSFNTAVPSVNVAKPRTNAFQKSHSSLRRPFYQQTALKNRNLNNKVNTAKVISVNTIKEKRMTSAVGEQGINAVKPTTYWAWRPKIKMINHVYKNTRSCISLATPGQTATGKESSNPFMAGSLPKTINSNNVDEESQKIGRQAQVMISDAKEYLISEDPVKQGRMEETENA